MVTKSTAKKSVVEKTEPEVKVRPKKEEGVLVSTKIVSAEKLPDNLSFKYNTRHPDGKSAIYKDMRKTLKEDPESFCGYNSGIDIANDEFILDGGHTYKALMDALKNGEDLSTVQVKVRYTTGLTPKSMIARSVKLNNKKTPPIRGQKDLDGSFDTLKKAVDKKYINLFEFRPNTKPEAPFKVELLIGMLNAWTAQTAEKSYSGKGSLTRNYDDKKYSVAIANINLAIELYSKIKKAYDDVPRVNMFNGVTKSESILPNGEMSKFDVPDAFVWPVFGAFRQFIDEDGEWEADPTVLFEKHGEAMLEQFLEDYKVKGRNPSKAGKDGTVYANQVILLTKKLRRAGVKEKKASGE